MKNLKPITRHEQFLQDIADGEVDLKPITRQEYFLAKIAESGGGGSSLPSYTSSDVGKTLTLEQQGSEETIIIPEQTVTTSGTFITKADLDGVTVETPPAVITVKLDGVVYEGVEYDSENGFYTVANGSGTIVGQIVPGSPWHLAKSPAGTYTVSASVVVTPPSVAPIWKTAGGIYFVHIHIDGETMSIVEDYTEVSNAVRQMPVYLVSPDGSGLVPISTNSGTALIGYVFEVIRVLGASDKLEIAQITISNTGSVSLERFTVDITPAE